ncbi:MAG: autotransporter outer membrane beta-barrel domain-containing protein, partial [Gammaproteobacteria bacterium]|nr:autotransporter outer membrane beta-barrel domain-containing protein [Gammaproteobacteria bacterium]
ELDARASALPVASSSRSMTARELLLGSSFHVADNGSGAGPGLAAWGRVAYGEFDGEERADDGAVSIDGEVLTGTLGVDMDYGQWLAGVSVSLSDGDGTFDDPGVDSGSIESKMTTVSPYLQYRLTERVSAWGLAGWGTGDMTIVQDARETTNAQAARDRTVTKTDIDMQLGAIGARGALLEQDGENGMDLALKADAFIVRMESDKAANTVRTKADASRVRLMLEAGHAWALHGDATLRPSLEVGVRHDGGDAETGTGVELGAGMTYADPASGLSIEASARMLVSHADSDYEEWGASATVRLDPGKHGHGLSFSLAPTIGTTSSAAERLWSAHDARALAPEGDTFRPAHGLTAQAGYGLSQFGNRFTGTPNIGLHMADDGARDWRIGWRLTSNVPNDPDFEIRLDATRRESANDNGLQGKIEHEAMLRGLIRW